MLALQEPCIVHELQILGNESKVPSRLELFCMDEDRAQAAGTGPAAWRLLGECYFDPNIRSGFTARELKRISLDENATKIMLRLHRCHPNKLNIYNQVGLVAIIPIGWPRYQRPDRDVESLGPAVVDAALELGIDDKVMEVIREVNKAKDAAIDREDYERAKSLKLGIDRLKKIGIRVAQLESQKILAVQMEDFDRARGIKEDIDKLRTNCHTLSVGMQGGGPQRRGVALLQQNRRRAEAPGVAAAGEGVGGNSEGPSSGPVEHSGPERAGGRTKHSFLSKGGGRKAGVSANPAVADTGGGPSPIRSGVERPLPAPKAGDSTKTAAKRAPAKARAPPTKSTGGETAKSKPVVKKATAAQKPVPRKDTEESPSPKKKTSEGQKEGTLAAAKSDGSATLKEDTKGGGTAYRAESSQSTKPDTFANKESMNADAAPEPPTATLNVDDKNGKDVKQQDNHSGGSGTDQPQKVEEAKVNPTESEKKATAAAAKTTNVADGKPAEKSPEKTDPPKKSPEKDDAPVEHDEKPIKTHSSYQSMLGSDSLGPDSVPNK